MADGGQLQDEDFEGLSQTYLGTFDDVVERYPWDVPINRDYLAQSIARHALLGGRLILNDGYLLQNSLAREALQKGLDSPLYNLMREGLVRIISADGDIVGSLRKRAESGVASIKAVIDSGSWSDIEPRLRQISRHQTDKKFLLHWPKRNIGAGFYQAMSRLRDHGRGDQFSNLGLSHTDQDLFMRVFDAFEARLDETYSSARTHWEAASRETISATTGLKKAEKALNELMGLANEGYHMNFASCLSVEHDFSVGVETHQSEAFNEFLDEPELLMEHLPAYREIPIPKDKAFQDPDRLRRFCVPGEAAFEAKRRYLTTVEAYMARDPNVTSETCDAAREEYVRFIAEHFGKQFRFSRRQKVGSIYITAASTVAGMAVDPTGGFAAAAIAFVTDQYVAPHIIKRISVRNLAVLLERPEWFEEQTGVRVMRTRGRRSKVGALRSVSLDTAKAAELNSGLPEFAG